jgi:hypothetical protein
MYPVFANMPNQTICKKISQSQNIFKITYAFKRLATFAAILNVIFRQYLINPMKIKQISKTYYYIPVKK